MSFFFVLQFFFEHQFFLDILIFSNHRNGESKINIWKLHEAIISLQSSWYHSKPGFGFDFEGKRIRKR